MSRAVYRAARAEDASPAAPLVYASGPSAFEHLFAPDPVRFLERCFARDAGLFGFGNHRVAELDGRVVAVGAFYDARTLRARTPGTVAAIVRTFGARSPRVLLRGARIESLLPPPGSGELYVAHLGVDLSVRGRGVMHGMLEERIAFARGQGYRRMSLDVARANPARRLYERLGFRVVELRRSTMGHGAQRVPDHYRMELELR